MDFDDEPTLIRGLTPQDYAGIVACALRPYLGPDLARERANNVVQQALYLDEDLTLRNVVGDAIKRVNLPPYDANIPQEAVYEAQQKCFDVLVGLGFSV